GCRYVGRLLGSWRSASARGSFAKAIYEASTSSSAALCGGWWRRHAGKSARATLNSGERGKPNGIQELFFALHRAIFPDKINSALCVPIRTPCKSQKRLLRSKTSTCSSFWKTTLMVERPGKPLGPAAQQASRFLHTHIVKMVDQVFASILDRVTA